MKRIFRKVAIVGFLGVLLTGCFKDDNYPSDNYWVDIATVENPKTKTEFFLRLDDSTLLWTASSRFTNYKPKDGQRIIANYTVVGDKRGTGLYDYDILLNDVYEVLTKQIFNVTPATKDSIGNDPIYISRIWVGSKYLNIEFYYKGYSNTHFINLVSDTTKTYTDGKIHLDFRHNANNDEPIHQRWGVVSFDISSLKDNAKDSVQLVIHANKPNQTTEESYNVSYKYKVVSGSSNVKRSDMIRRFDDYIPEDEVK
ncbi:hypothetical protein MASR2M117_19950 [Paludibacter sp.]